MSGLFLFLGFFGILLLFGFLIGAYSIDLEGVEIFDSDDDFQAMFSNGLRESCQLEKQSRQK